jgi:hypothetical protein
MFYPRAPKSDHVSSNYFPSTARSECLWFLPGRFVNGTQRLRSTSQDPRLFRLPALSLNASATYVVTLRVTDRAGVANSARAVVRVRPGPLTAVIRGGDRVIGGWADRGIGSLAPTGLEQERKMWTRAGHPVHSDRLPCGCGDGDGSQENHES